MEDDARREVLVKLYRSAGKDPEPLRGPIDRLSMDDFRRDIGAPPRRQTSG